MHVNFPNQQSLRRREVASNSSNFLTSWHDLAGKSQSQKSHSAWGFFNTGSFNVIIFSLT
jgi:hypothetical protein